MRPLLIAGTAVWAFAFSVPGARADIGINPRLGTLGYGIELSAGVNDKLSVGLGFNNVSRTRQDNTDGVDYQFDLRLRSAELLANYHPMGGAFRLRAGVLLNRNEFELTGKPGGTGTYDFNGVTYTAAQVGSLTGKLSFNKTSPYLGLGWGNRPNGSWGVTFDLGAVYQGKPKLGLEATGAAADPTLAADLEAERQQAEDDLSSFKWWPVIQLGMYFRF